MRTVQQVSVGTELKAGIINGNTGIAKVTALTDESTSLQVALTEIPPAPLPLTLIVALPRPKMLKRILQTVSTMGVKELILINSYRVEKSFWQTPFLETQKIEEQLTLGLEQGVDTRMPSVTLEKRFKPFVEDQLPDLCKHKRALVAHPKNAVTCPAPTREESVLVIGPEGGFIDYEIEKLNQAGCQTIHLGPRILRVETAVPVLLSRLFPVF
tara:strand:+ start:11634 stop:12272 length:639 start_codon:yes stop_codon:yes gene_type:complete